MILFRWVSLMRDARVFWLAERARDGLWFVKAKRRGSFAQHDEDRFLLDYFADHQGVYIDVGASHPFKISNTYALYRRGWYGATLEPIPRLYLEHKRLRPRDIQLNAGVSERPGSLRFHELVPSVLSTFDTAAAQRAVDHSGAIRRRVYDVPVTTLEEVRAQHFPNRRIDLLSIDVEGAELAVLDGWDWTHLPPKIIVCETVQPDGAEDRTTALTTFLSAHGYGFLHQFGCNAVYQHSVK
jgi:FkbM family methyltransferase